MRLTGVADKQQSALHRFEYVCAFLAKPFETAQLVMVIIASMRACASVHQMQPVTVHKLDGAI
jgi:hypothetical protein